MKAAIVEMYNQYAAENATRGSWKKNHASGTSCLRRSPHAQCIKDTAADAVLGHER